MKNHAFVDGELLQTNKKWSALKQSQREWIHSIVREEHAAYVTANGRLPMKKRKDEIVSRCYSRLDERGIWIPFGEFCIHINKQLDRLNRSNPLSTQPDNPNTQE